MEDERLTAECEKLFGHRAAHAKAPSGGRDKSHDVVIHDWSLGGPYSSRKACKQVGLRNLSTNVPNLTAPADSSRAKRNVDRPALPFQQEQDRLILRQLACDALKSLHRRHCLTVHFKHDISLPNT